MMDALAILVVALSIILLAALISWRLARPRSSVKPINVKRSSHNGTGTNP